MDKRVSKIMTDTTRSASNMVFIEDCCNFFGIQYHNQKKVINENEFLHANKSLVSSKELFGDNVKRIALTKEGFVAWILQINPTIVYESLRNDFRAYQSNIFSFIFGSIEEKESLRTLYSRLNKLEKLKRKINRELGHCKRKVNAWVHNELVQKELDFDKKELADGK